MAAGAESWVRFVLEEKKQPVYLPQVVVERHNWPRDVEWGVQNVGKIVQICKH